MTDHATASFRSYAAIGGVAPAIETKIVETPADFRALEGEWNDLADRAARAHNVFQDFGVLEIWLRHYSEPGDRLAVMVARQDGHAVAILPLIRRRALGLDTLRFMGAPIARFNDLLAEPGCGDELARSLKNALASTGAHLLEAPLVRSDAAFVRIGLDGGAVVAGEAEAPYCQLEHRVGRDGPGEAYDARTRSNYRRRLRRLAEDGVIELRQLGPGEDAARLVREAIRMKKSRLERAGVAAPAVFDPRFGADFESMAQDGRTRAVLRIASIERNGQPVGIDLSLDFRDSCFGHVIATDEAAEANGVGSVLVHHVFAAAKARGRTRFELLTPADPHKMRHADGTVSVRDVLVPLTPLGRIAALALARGLPAAKSLARRLPPGLVRAIITRTGG